MNSVKPLALAIIITIFAASACSQKTETTKTPAAGQSKNPPEAPASIIESPLKDALNKLTKKERLMLGAIISRANAAFVGAINVMSPLEKAALSGMRPNGMLSDDIRELYRADIVRSLLGSFSDDGKTANYIYADKRIPKEALGKPALIAAIDIISDPATVQADFFSKYQVAAEGYFLLSPGQTEASLARFFLPVERALFAEDFNKTIGLDISVEGLETGETLKLIAVNNGGKPIALPIFDPKIPDDVDKNALIGKIGMYRQVAWHITDKNGDVVSYWRPLYAVDKLKPEEGVFRNLFILNPGKKLNLMLTGQSEALLLLSDQAKFKTLGPFELTACFVEPIAGEEYMKKNLPTDYAAADGAVYFKGAVCGKKIKIDKPITVPQQFAPNNLRNFMDKPLADKLGLPK